MLSKFPHKKYLRFWQEERAFTVLLITLIATVFVIYPLVEYQEKLIKLLLLFICINFVAGVYAVTISKVYRIAGWLLTMLLIAIGFTSVGDQLSYGRIIELLLMICYFGFLALIIMIRVFSVSKVNFHRIQGAIVVYILFGLTFSFIYMLINKINHGAFNISDVVAQSSQQNEYKFVYFSFITLCTIGYGDITPVSNVAQSIAMLEAILGILFPAVLIARLISLPKEETINDSAKDKQQS